MREPSKCKCGSITFRVFIAKEYGENLVLQCTDCGVLYTECQLEHVVPDSPQPVGKNIERIETDEYVFINNEEA